MINFITKFSGNFLKDKQGSVAIETSIILPLILIPMTLATVDVGIAINAGQSLTSASRSGSQYLLNGGTEENHLKGVIVDSYNGSLTNNNIAIATSCACPNESAIPSSEGGEGGNSEGTSQNAQDVDPYSLRNVTLATIDQCSATCSDSSQERVLVNLRITHTSNGLYKSYPLHKEVSVRVK